ncbi:hypothetical protein ACLMJK_003709 [Lecanora helva]
MVSVPKTILPWLVLFKARPSSAKETIREGYQLTNVNTRDPSKQRNKYDSQLSSTLSLLSGEDDNSDGKENPRIYQGWRMSVLVCTVTAVIVLLINFVFTIWVSKGYDLVSGLATVEEGSCQKTKTLSLWLHLAINALSTILLSASNYCMQCLASPTRSDVDRAHRQRVWLDIGVPSVRNLRYVSRFKVALWWSLALSSIPLHLLYNSAVFSSVAAVEYTVYAGSHDLAAGTVSNWSSPIIGSMTHSRLQALQDAPNWQRLDNKECIKAYGQQYVSAHGDLLAVSPDFNSAEQALHISDISPSDLGSATSAAPYSWICTTTTPLIATKCDLNVIEKNAPDWTLLNATHISDSASNGDNTLKKVSVDYCLSQPMEERCRLQFSVIIMSIVIFCNLVKATCMFLTFQYHQSQPLLTIGDAINSFLQQRDSTTENMCMATRNTFIEDQWRYVPSTWQPTRHQRFKAASARRWYISNLLCIATLIIAISLLSMGLNASSLSSKSFSHLWSLGFGTVTTESMANWKNSSTGGGLILTIIVANLPQALLSFLFLTYNSLFTCMLLAEEWNGYAHERKTLRVTHPVAQQRSTYRLHLPYRYGIPLLILSGTLHWFVSQSLFLARVTAFTPDGEEDTQASISTIGYSCIAIITTIILGGIIIVLGIVIGFRKYKPGMPLAGSCSAAISAACHRPDGDEDAERKKVMWGAVGPLNEEGIGHCSFTSWEVEPLIEGKRYSGSKE